MASLNFRWCNYCFALRTFQEGDDDDNADNAMMMMMTSITETSEQERRRSHTPDVCSGPRWTRLCQVIIIKRNNFDSHRRNHQVEQSLSQSVRSWLTLKCTQTFRRAQILEKSLLLVLERENCLPSNSGLKEATFCLKFKLQ